MHHEHRNTPGFRDEPTNPKKSKDALVADEVRITAILATIEDVVWSISARSYETLYLNPAAEKVYGRSAGVFYQDPELFMNIVHTEDRERVAKMLPKLVEKGSLTIQYRIVRPDGEVRWLDDRVSVARSSGRPTGQNRWRRQRHYRAQKSGGGTGADRKARPGPPIRTPSRITAQHHGRNGIRSCPRAQSAAFGNHQLPPWITAAA
jgi:PAS domain S-box-containing protein